MADATNFWKLRVLAAPVRDKASKADFSKIDGANPEAEATYRIFLALYNLLSSSKIPITATLMSSGISATIFST